MKNLRKKGIPIFYEKYLKRANKYKIYSHKLYSPRDIERRTGIKEEKIIALLEKKKTIGRKLGNFWFIRGSEILEIKKLLKGTKK